MREKNVKEMGKNFRGGYTTTKTTPKREPAPALSTSRPMHQ